MIVKARGGFTALSVAVAGAAALGAALPHAAAATYIGSIANTTGTPTAVLQTQVEAAAYFGTGRFSIEGATAGGPSYQDFGTLDFNANNISTDGGVTTGLGALTQVTAINNITLSLTDYDEYFAVGGKIDLYLTNNNVSTSGLTYQTDAASQPQGIGHQLDTLFSVGQITYAPANSTTSGSGGPSAGTFYNTTLSLSSAAKSYITNQLNTGGNVRLVLAADSPTVAADFNSVTAASGAPSLAFNLTTATFTPANSTLSIGGSKTANITFSRVCVGTSNATQTLTLTNSGPDAGTYSVNGITNDPSNPQSATGVGTAGTNPVPGSNGTVTITAGIKPVAANAGFGPATATITVHDQSNPVNDGDITITATATTVVTNRFINNLGGTAGVNFAPSNKGILGGTSATLPVTFTTTNTNVPDFTGNTLTVLSLAGNASIPSTQLSSTNSGVTDHASIAADASNTTVTFGSVDGTDPGTETETRNVTFSPSTAVGGLYGTKKFYDGYVALVPTLAAGENAIGASTNNSARVYFTTDVYQPASVTSAANGTIVMLTNAAHTVNNATISGTKTDIGVRASAQVTSVSLTAQGGWSVDPGLVASTTIGDGASITAANFATAGKLNGTYTGTLAVGLQNEQDLLGAAPNDLGTSNLSLSTTVSTNSGNGIANILTGGSFAGYNIHRGSGKDSTASFLAGSSASGGNISVAWADGVNTSLSDKATVGTTSASDLYVLQMSYDPAAVTHGTTSPTLAENVGGHFIGATFGNTGGSAFEINGAYDGNLTLGHYGIDTTNHVVWAVVNSAGDFESIQRLPGDANGDGHVDLTDLSTVLNGFGSTTALWSSGNFDGAATIDLTDLSAVLNNFGATPPSASDIVASGSGAIADTPEPASLGVLSLGMIALIKRRR